MTISARELYEAQHQNESYRIHVVIPYSKKREVAQTVRINNWKRLLHCGSFVPRYRTGNEASIYGLPRVDSHTKRLMN
jgi:hypothetical protein